METELPILGHDHRMHQHRRHVVDRHPVPVVAGEGRQILQHQRRDRMHEGRQIEEGKRDRDSRQHDRRDQAAPAKALETGAIQAPRSRHVQPSAFMFDDRFRQAAPPVPRAQRHKGDRLLAQCLSVGYRVGHDERRPDGLRNRAFCACCRNRGPAEADPGCASAFRRNRPAATFDGGDAPWRAQRRQAAPPGTS